MTTSNKSTSSSSSSGGGGGWASLLKVGSGIAVAAFVIGWWYEVYAENRTLKLQQGIRRQQALHRDAIDERPGGRHRLNMARGYDPKKEKEDLMKVKLNEA